MHDEPDDALGSEEFLSDAESIHQLRYEVAVLQVRLTALERELKQFDTTRMREQIAVLNARVESLIEHRESTANHMGRLVMPTLCVLAIAVTNLAITIVSVGKQ